MVKWFSPMAIFIRIEDDALEAGLKALAALQRPRAAMTRLGEEILREAVRACESDPEAWKKIGALAASPSILGDTTDCRPDGSVSDIESDEAGPVSTPPASQSASQSGSPDDAI